MFFKSTKNRPVVLITFFWVENDAWETLRFNDVVKVFGVSIKFYRTIIIGSGVRYTLRYSSSQFARQFSSHNVLAMQVTISWISPLFHYCLLTRCVGGARFKNSLHKFLQNSLRSFGKLLSSII